MKYWCRRHRDPLLTIFVVAVGTAVFWAVLFLTRYPGMTSPMQ